MRNLSKPMLKPRKPRSTNRSTTAWFYISPTGIEIYARLEGSTISTRCVLSTVQLERALQVIHEWKKTA